VAILDEFDGEGEHDLEVNFQFAPGDLIDIGGAVRFGEVEMAWASEQPWTATLARGGDAPSDGWIAPSLGVRVPAPRLSLRCRANVRSATLLTVLAARAGDARTMSPLKAGDGQAILLGVRSAHFTDVIAAPRASTAEPIRTDARLAACRLPDDPAAPVEVDRVGGTSIEADRAALVRLTATGDWT
jgi:hypothetical protein